MTGTTSVGLPTRAVRALGRHWRRPHHLMYLLAVRARTSVAARRRAPATPLGLKVQPRRLRLPRQGGRSLERARQELEVAAAAELDAFLRSGDRLELASADEPVVSVALVIYGRAELALRCLKSLTAVTVPLEVIVVDNGSPDRTPDMLQQVDGATVLSEDTNLGYLRAAQAAADRARGRTILFLNSDVEVHPGSIEAALACLDETGAGAVGGPLLLPHGALQEAGSVVWSDGSTGGVGRADDPRAARYQFRRPVDYCSAAFLLVRREAWIDVEGFDDGYAPAYYEDVDLCMRFWERGWPVIYEPRAVASHFEYASSDATKAIGLMERNRARFAQRHAATLAGLPTNASEPHPLLRRCGPPRVLLIEDRVPVMDLGSGFPRSLRVVEALLDLGWFVTLYPMLPLDKTVVTSRRVPEGVEVMLGWGPRYLTAFLEERRGAYDAVIVSRRHNMRFVRDLRLRHPDVLEGTRLIYDPEALSAAREIAGAAVNGMPMDPLRAEELLDAEIRLAEGADLVIAVSDNEAAAIRARVNGTPVAVLSHAVNAQPTTNPFAGRRDLLFVGPLLENDTPNTDSVRWFATEILPRVRDALGEQAPILRVVGRLGAIDIKADASLELIGPVDDLTPFYASARLFVAPTRFSAGVPIKVIEAAAHGLPVVATELLRRQLGWHDNELASAPHTDPEKLAAGIIDLYGDAGQWDRQRQAALRRVRQDCSAAAFREQLRLTLATAARPPGTVTLP